MNKILKIISFIVGLILILGSMGGYASKDYIGASVALFFGLGFLFLSLKDKIFRWNEARQERKWAGFKARHERKLEELKMKQKEEKYRNIVGKTTNYKPLSKIKSYQKDSDEYYNRKDKEGDEGFCSACGAVIKKEAEICPKCGVRNNIAENNTRLKGSIGWLIFWVLIFWPIAIYYGLTRRWK